jgi:hypothetical protein
LPPSRPGTPIPEPVKLRAPKPVRAYPLRSVAEAAERAEREQERKMGGALAGFFGKGGLYGNKPDKPRFARALHALPNTHSVRVQRLAPSVRRRPGSRQPRRRAQVLPRALSSRVSGR